MSIFVYLKCPLFATLPGYFLPLEMLSFVNIRSDFFGIFWDFAQTSNDIQQFAVVILLIFQDFA